MEQVQRKRLIEIMKAIYMNDNVNKKDVSAKAIWMDIAAELNQMGPAKEAVRWRKVSFKFTILSRHQKKFFLIIL